MKSLAKCMPEYETVLSMSGVGETLGSRLIAEIGNPRLFHMQGQMRRHINQGSLPAQKGIYQSEDHLL